MNTYAHIRSGPIWRVIYPRLPAGLVITRFLDASRGPSVSPASDSGA
jgi:hypothetical protein